MFTNPETVSNLLELYIPSRERVNYIYPGCQSPLLSSQLKENRTHFTRIPKRPEAKSDVECSFS
ncbi:hypothetical protein TERTU_2365 [Teredinibacter turnerae T7901]|uniref:Uncharacterized protein n=1 Tax=Teredinibacter turnerae (strain ATCC 39867 / T7901) TaxID=377629 RepID=C5BKA6_TERTT|nr:hypothetical protein [Teredinibacter turnerae]ACR14006.1 hypothetical protein TERTU_2365 [Teredinibacter turnerae T7901]